MDNFFTNLDSLDVLEVSGEDSEKFLQGQLTCDVAELGQWQWRPGAACNSKGRVYSSFRVVRLPTGFYLVMQPGLLESARATLQKYIPFYRKAVMADGSGKYRRLGLAGDDATRLLGARFGQLPVPGACTPVGIGVLINVSGILPRFELWLEPAVDDDLAPLFAALPQATLDAWQVSDMQDGLCLIAPDSAEAHTPEELSMDLAGFISFDKGCYTGQEIVARMHYRGKAKKRLFIISGSHTGATPGPDLLDSEGTPLGTVFNLHFADDQHFYCWAVLNVDKAPTQGALSLDGESTIPVRISPAREHRFRAG